MNKLQRTLLRISAVVAIWVTLWMFGLIKSGAVVY
jgi:hypothetical protein